MADTEKKAKGGKRPGAGRQKGSRNKRTIQKSETLTALAQAHTEDAVATLASIMMNVEAEDAPRIAAARILLDRGHGRPAQQITAPVAGAEALALETQAVRGSRLLADLISQIDGAVDQAHYKAIAALPAPDGEVIEVDFEAVDDDQGDHGDAKGQETAKADDRPADPIGDVALADDLTRASLF